MLPVLEKQSNIVYQHNFIGGALVPPIPHILVSQLTHWELDGNNSFIIAQIDT